MPVLGSIFELGIPLSEIFIRGSVTFLALLIMMRVIGQREGGALSITDLLPVVLVAEAAGAGLHGEASSVTDGVVLVATILFWSITLDAIAYRWPKLGRFMKAQPRLLIKDGAVNPQVVRRELMTRDEVVSQLRLHGIEDLAEVERAYIEMNGMISVVRRDNVTARRRPGRAAA